MKRLILMGRSEAGKTTLTQALKGETITYKKTQYVNYFDVIIDTPGEYAQTAKLLFTPMRRMWWGFCLRPTSPILFIRPTLPAW